MATTRQYRIAGLVLLSLGGCINIQVPMQAAHPMIHASIPPRERWVLFPPAGQGGGLSTPERPTPTTHAGDRTWHNALTLGKIGNTAGHPQSTISSGRFSCGDDGQHCVVRFYAAFQQADNEKVRVRFRSGALETTGFISRGTDPAAGTAAKEYSLSILPCSEDMELIFDFTSGQTAANVQSFLAVWSISSDCAATPGTNTLRYRGDLTNEAGEPLPPEPPVHRLW